MRTLKQVNDEIGHWVQETDRLSAEAAALEKQIEKISPNGGVLFGNIEKREKLTADLRRVRLKEESARREQQRLREEAVAVRRHVDEMKRSLSVYERQLEPGGIDWSRVEDPAIDKTAHLAELSEKAERLRAQIARWGDA